MSSWRREGGSTFPFILGLIAIVASVGAVFVETTFVSIERSRVDAIADDAALAAASRIDLHQQPKLTAYSGRRLLLARREAKAAAARAVEHFPARDLSERRLEQVQFVRGAVRVVVSARVRPPFTAIVRRATGDDGTVLVRGFAAAAAYTQPLG